MGPQLDATAQSTDSLFRLLGHRYRRGTVRALDGSDDPLSLGALAERIASRSPDATGSPAEPVSDVYRMLYHTHVPKLAAADVVSYDRSRGTVAPTDRLEQFVAVLDVAP